jgi:hypothetical protein
MSIESMEEVVVYIHKGSGVPVGMLAEREAFLLAVAMALFVLGLWFGAKTNQPSEISPVSSMFSLQDHGFGPVWARRDRAGLEW